MLLSDQSDESQSSSSDEDSSSEDEVDESDSRPCTSQSAQNPRPTRRGRRKKQSGRGRVAGKVSNGGGVRGASKVSQSKVRPAAKLAAVLTECPVEYRPPEWLTSTRPKKTPYVPQMGDEVVYFRQGHELYVKAVREAGAYELEKEVMPWDTHEIDVMEHCKVRVVNLRRLSKFLVQPNGN